MRRIAWLATWPVGWLPARLRLHFEGVAEGEQAGLRPGGSNEGETHGQPIGQAHRLRQVRLAGDRGQSHLATLEPVTGLEVDLEGPPG
mgnify:CR=1 FL=1